MSDIFCNDYCHSVSLIVETSEDNFLTLVELLVQAVLPTRDYVLVIFAVSVVILSLML